jgi:tetratricopeptide (TPR) repeat protein
MIRALFFCSLAAFAHGDLHDQIEKTTREIAANPSNAALYLKRGELHRLHHAYAPALADYAQAERIDRSISGVELGRARAFADQKQWPEAEAAVTRYIARVPANETALALRAEIRDNAQKPSAADWAAAIAASAEPRVDHYIALAEAHARYGAHGEALRAIEQGIAKLGPLVTLRQWAVESLARQRRWEEAIARVDTLIAESPRKESWLARKAELQKSAMQFERARETAAAARGAIQQLPPRVQQTKAVLDLVARLEAVTSGIARR